MSSDLKQLKFGTFEWVVGWTNDEKKVEEAPVDLPGLINIFQALGFHLRSHDIKTTQEASNLNANEKGISLTLTCNHSGHTFHLEKLTDENQCQCVNVQDDNCRDSFWEVTATKPSDNQSDSLLETGCDLIPALTKNASQVVKDIANHLLHVINTDHRSQPLNKKSSNMKTISRSTDNLFKIPSVVVSTSRKSLDTLLATGPRTTSKTTNYLASDLPTKRNAKSTSDLDQVSSLNTTMELPRSPGNIDNAQTSKFYALVKSAYSSLYEAIALTDTSFLNYSNDSVFSTSTNIETSCASHRLNDIVNERATSSPCILRSVTNQSAGIKSKGTTGVRKLEVPKSNSSLGIKRTTANKNVIERRENAQRSSSTTDLTSTAKFKSKSSKLYEHVKSTIPKISKKK